MKPAYNDNFCRMFVGDATKVLAELPEKSIHCCVTSPPYFGLRSYLPDTHPDKAREGGTQETPEQYVAWLVDVFRGVWRVLRDDGTCWLNLGDSYASGGMSNPSSVDALDGGKDRGASGYSITRKPPAGLKPKDLLMIPPRVAIALQADGWYLRSQIVWTKPNPMPESVTDRPTQATEMVYLLTKKPRYFYDADAVKEAHTTAWRKDKWLATKARVGSKTTFNGDGTGPTSSLGNLADPAGRNLRNYWQISTRPYPGSHYATFPPELPLRCIKAGTSEHGVCSECGSPWRRVVERPKAPDELRNRNGGSKLDYHTQQVGSGRKLQGWYDANPSHTTGFAPTCSHDADIQPATVLDPFSGSGTTGLVARKLGRRSVLIDIDDRNVKLLEQRMGYQSVLF